MFIRHLYANQDLSKSPTRVIGEISTDKAPNGIVFESGLDRYQLRQPCAHMIDMNLSVESLRTLSKLGHHTPRHSCPPNPQAKRNTL